MAKHDVSFKVPQRALGKEDVQFNVDVDGSPLGRLEISNGAVVWFPKGKKTGYKVAWRKFDEMMREAGRRAERR